MIKFEQTRELVAVKVETLEDVLAKVIPEMRTRKISGRLEWDAYENWAELEVFGCGSLCLLNWEEGAEFYCWVVFDDSKVASYTQEQFEEAFPQAKNLAVVYRRSKPGHQQMGE